MYQNNESLKLGEDHYNLETGEYAFTYVYNGDQRFEVEGFDVPETVTEIYPTGTTYINEVWAFVKTTNELIDEDSLYDLCYNDIYVSKERLDQLVAAKDKIQAIIDEAGISEPFVFEGGKLSVGKEHVLSAHIQAGYDKGWISSSICW